MVIFVGQEAATGENYQERGGVRGAVGRQFEFARNRGFLNNNI